MIHFYYQNVRGLRTKTTDFFNNIVCNNYDIIALSETWLNSGVFDSELFDCRYAVYRRDRETSGFHSGKNGGGVLIAVSKRLNSRRLQTNESKCEDLWVEVECRNNSGSVERLLLCVVYLPPPIQRHVLEEFVNNSNQVIERNSLEKVMFIGDFNLGSINWNFSNDSDLLVASKSTSSFTGMLLDFCMLNDLKQYNDVLNVKGKILDLVISNAQVCNLRSNDISLTKVDDFHPPLQFSLFSGHHTSLKYNNVDHFCFFKADYAMIINDLNNINWEDEFEDCATVNDMLTVFYDHIHKLIIEHVPKTKRRSRNYPIWFTRELIGLLREKFKYRNKLRKFNNNPLDQIAFDLARKRSEILMTTCYKNYILGLEHNLRSNPKLFWSYTKNKKKSNSSYPDKMFYEDKTSSSGLDICNFFALNFRSNHVCHNSANNGTTSKSNNSLRCSYLTSIKFKDDHVLKVLKRLDLYKGAGSDGIPSVFVAKSAPALVRPLRLIYNKSLSTGIFPADWKVALVVPLFKSGDKEQVKNYRPISILPVFAKIFEQLLCPLLSWHLKQEMNPCQHGFTRAKSTATNLTLFINEVSLKLDSRSSVEVIYTDFSKAFDRVNHQTLLQKLSQHGISEPLLSWCGSYLSDRLSKVVVNGYCSDSYLVMSGVPQGSHLGPLLFNVFINDIGDCFHHSRYCLFADDLKFFRTVDNAFDSELLQEDLNRLVDWCDLNDMELNTSKCYTMRFSRKKNIVNTNYTIKSQHLKEVNTIRDLGVQLDTKLQFNVHIDKVCSNAFKNLGFILRNCKDFKSPYTKLLLFNSFVRSGLEYCSVAWNPFYDVYTKRIERVQKRFLWHLTYSVNLGKVLLSYEDRLKYFKILSLTDRRRMLDLVFLYKLANGILDTPELLSSLCFSTPSRLSRPSRYQLLKTSMCKSNLGQNAPLNRLIREFNKYAKSNDIDLFTDSIGKFRRSILDKNVDNFILL